MCEYLSRSSVTVVKWLRLQFELEYYPPPIVTKNFIDLWQFSGCAGTTQNICLWYSSICVSQNDGFSRNIKDGSHSLLTLVRWYTFFVFYSLALSSRLYHLSNTDTQSVEGYCFCLAFQLSSINMTHVRIVFTLLSSFIYLRAVLNK